MPQVFTASASLPVHVFFVLYWLQTINHVVISNRLGSKQMPNVMSAV